MHIDLDDRLGITLPEAGELLAQLPEPFAVLFKRGDLSVELFAPHEVDTQQPHEQDEIYLVAAGTGTFRRGTARVPFGPCRTGNTRSRRSGKPLPAAVASRNVTSPAPPEVIAISDASAGMFKEVSVSRWLLPSHSSQRPSRLIPIGMTS